MTYCLGMLLNEGLVFAADTRTNAGVDHVASFRKMRVYEKSGDRVIVLLSAGNLSITQSVVNELEEAVRRAETNPETETVWSAKSMFGVARLVGEALREVHRSDAHYLKEFNTDFNASIIVGGQIKGERPRLFQLYAAGNFIEAGEETPYLQIGEIKYGKPILDRVITPETDLVQAAKCALVSFDSTIRSNLSVGLPIDLLCYRTDSLKVAVQRRIGEDDPYFQKLRHLWGDGVRQLFIDLPEPKWALDNGVVKTTLR